MAKLRALIGAAALGVALGAVHPYRSEYFYAVNDAIILRGGREGLFASQSAAADAWGNVAPGIANGKSYIRFSRVQLFRPPEVAEEFSRKGSSDSGLVQAVIFEVGDRDRIGYATAGGGRRYCCTPELVAKTKCHPGRLIVQPRPGNENWPWQTDIYFSQNRTVAYAVDETVTIEETGMYYMWFVICDANLAGVTISGQTTWKNPQGYLPGMMAPNLGFFGFMSLAYLALALVWFTVYARNWRHIMTLHNCITLVVALGMIEMSTWYFDYVNFNTTGFRPYGNTVWAVLVGSARKAVSRMLVLVVAMGYGVVRPTLGGISSRVVAVGACYFIAVATLEMMTNVGSIDDLTSSARVFLVVPVAILDAVYILWIFTSLSKTLSQLQSRRQMAKLQLYRNFTNTLAVAVVVSIGWIGYEMYFKIADEYNEQWESDWVTGAFWHLSNLVLIAAICFLWCPSDSGKQYAFSGEGHEELEWDEEGAASRPFARAVAPPPLAPAGPPVPRAELSGQVFNIDDGDDGPGKME